MGGPPGRSRRGRLGAALGEARLDAGKARGDVELDGGELGHHVAAEVELLLRHRDELLAHLWGKVWNGKGSAGERAVKSGL